MENVSKWGAIAFISLVFAVAVMVVGGGYVKTLSCKDCPCKCECK